MDENTKKGYPRKSVDMGKGKKAYSLKPQQEEFIKYYLETFNVRKAATLAGYKDYTGNDLMKNPLISDKINMGITALFKKYGVDGETILTELRNVAFEKEPLTKGIKYSDKINALKLLGTQLGLFKEQSDEKTLQPPSITVVIDSDKTSSITVDESNLTDYKGGMIQ
jgi:hypothetical protein